MRASILLIACFAMMGCPQKTLNQVKTENSPDGKVTVTESETLYLDVPGITSLFVNFSREKAKLIIKIEDPNIGTAAKLEAVKMLDQMDNNINMFIATFAKAIVADRRLVVEEVDGKTHFYFESTRQAAVIPGIVK